MNHHVEVDSIRHIFHPAPDGSASSLRDVLEWASEKVVGIESNGMVVTDVSIKNDFEEVGGEWSVCLYFRPAGESVPIRR